MTVGDWVRCADEAAYPGITGEVTAEHTVTHAVSGLPVARYLTVSWQGWGPKPDSSQHEDAVRVATHRVVAPTLF